MSLRTKTLLLFLSFVTLPLILLGFAFSRGARGAVEDVVRDNLQERVQVVAMEIDGSVARTRTRLERVSNDAAVEATLRRAWSERPASGLAKSLLAGDAELAASLDSIQVRDRSGSVLSSAGSPDPVDARIQRCSPSEAPVVELAVGVDLGEDIGSGLSITGFVSPTRLLSSAASMVSHWRGRTMVMDRRSGVVFSIGDCPSADQISSWTGVLGQVGESSGPESFRFSADEGDPVAFLDLENPEWTVASGIRSASIAAPMEDLSLGYGALVLLVALAALLAFNLLGGRLFRSFHELREAVEEIGQGDFAPWLPPPVSDEIGSLSVSLGRMTERIQHMVHSVEQFGRLAVLGEMAAHVAHEIRTPLSSIKLNLQRLMRDVDSGIVPERSRSAIESGIREADRLEGTIRSILQLGSAGEDQPRRPSSLHDLIGQSVEVIGDWIEERGLRLHLELDAESDRIRVAPGPVRGVILNLLVNAADVTPEGGRITIETRLQLSEDGRQMIAAAVSDTGPGVPPSIRSQIFNPFFTTKEDGNGLGLAASLKTAREHGGDLFLSDRPPGASGACFVLVLPVFPEDQRTPTDMREGKADSSLSHVRERYSPIARRPVSSWRWSSGEGAELD